MTEWWNEKLLGLDIESTSADPFTALPVTITYILLEHGTVKASKTQLVNPGVPIPDEAAAIHGISTEEAREHGMHLDEAIDFAGLLVERAADAGTPIVAYNAAYDLTVLNRLAVERNVSFRLGPVIDPLVIDKQMDPFRKGKRTLTAAVTHYGLPEFDAHSSEADTLATLRLAWTLAARWPAIRIDPTTLHRRQVTWHMDQAISLERWLRKKEPKARVNRGWPVYDRVPLEDPNPWDGDHGEAPF